MKMPISNKQKQILAFPFTKYDALIADGAIRSGKTVFMMVAFVDDAMRRFNNQRFGICGKTVDSTVKNIITPYVGLNYAKEKYAITWKRTDKLLVVSDGEHENIFEIFGGKDESSFMLIQGRTLAGVLFDEVALQPQSFVEQALARCSVEGSRFWFNCNPDVPNHWFYQSWVQKPKEHNALHLHFELEDNPSLSEKIINRYKTMHSGVFYRRYILGEWCVAEGLVYDFGEDNITDETPTSGEYYLSIDYGTMNPFSCGLWCVLGGKAVRIKEYYYSGRGEKVMKTDEEYCDEVDKLTKDYMISKVIVDPSAASFIASLRKRGYSVQKANNDVIDGIRRTSVYLKEGKVLIHRNCADAIREFGLYRWDDKSTEDKVIKENDHAMDEIRYFCNTVLKHKFKQNNEYKPMFMMLNGGGKT
jgi:PBSX family phage terminase large subunit